MTVAADLGIAEQNSGIKFSVMLRKTPLKAKTPQRTKSYWKNKLKNNEIVEAKEKKPRKRSSTPNYVADMDKVFQYYIRLRDVMPGGYGRCISCGKIKPFNHLQAGHFFGRAHFSTRWHEDNVNAECEWDNCWNSEHLLTYKENLLKKIGMKRFQLLEVLHKQPRKWSDFELKALIKHYSGEILRLSVAKHLPVSQEVQRIIKKYQKMSL